MSRVLALRLAMVGSFVVAILAPALILAATISPGCHATTPAEAAQRQQMGIPPGYQTCPEDMQILGIGETFDQWYAKVRTTSPCSKNTCTISCKYRNTGAQMCGPTATRWDSIGCGTHKFAIFPSVAYGFAAHIELLRRYCGEQGRCTIASVVAKWAPAGDNNNPSKYSAFVSNISGIPTNQVFNPNDVNTVARLAVGMACMEAGALPYSVQDLKEGLAMAAGGARVPVPANLGQLLQESQAGPFIEDANGANIPPMQSWVYPQNSTFGGNYVVQPSPAYPPAPIQQQLGTPVQVASAAPAAVGTPNTVGSAASTGTSNAVGNTAQILASMAQSGQTYSATSSQANPNVPPAAGIIAQPNPVHPGGTVLLSWATVGMSPSSPCTVYQGGTTLVTANEGSKGIPVPSDTPPGAVTFTLKCTGALAGDQIVRSVSVKVQ